MLFFKQCPVSYNTPYEKIDGEVRSLADEVPFDIPDSWEWVTLQTIATSSLGKTLDKAKNKGNLKPYLCSINVYWDGIDLTTVKEARLEENELPKYLLRPGDLLICEGGDVGRSAVWESTQEMYYQNALHRVRFYGGINPHYFQLLLECYKGNQILDAYSKGMTIKHLVQTALNTIVFPLPPLSEQTRIVNAVKRLLPYLHSYDKAEQKLTALNTGFPEALKKSILQEAVQGKLVPQDSSDEPAEALLERVRAEKQRLVKEGKIKKDKHESVIFRRDNSHYEKLDGTERCIDDKLPFEIPDTWIWTRLNTLGYTQTGNTPSTAHPEYRGDYIPFITPGDIADGSIDYTNQGLSEVGKNVARVCPADSILQVCIGGSIGKAALSISEVTFNQQINAITPIFASSKYVFAVLTSFAFLSAMKESAGGTATPILNRSLWDKMYIPVPPLAEQNRIVQRIEELLPLVKGL